MDLDKFHKMDLNYYKNLLNKKKSIDHYETKYQKLISNYSNAYLTGSNWYVGPSFTKYIKNESIFNIIPTRLKIICNILKDLD
jgi:hypothetical protein